MHTVNIAVDAMGGDYAPEEVVKGATRGCRRFEVGVHLYGETYAILRCLPSDYTDIGVRVEQSTEVVGMGEHASAFRAKRDSSLTKAVVAVQQGKADAFIGFGNTAATMAASTLVLGRLPGVERPAIATVWPTVTGQPMVFLDAGAVVDCTSANLLQFAEMGAIYARAALGVEKPLVKLLSVGEERGKGNKTTNEAYGMLRGSRLNFSGNIEANRLLCGEADVVVCDGFSGNIALKAFEGTAEMLLGEINADIRRHPLLWLPALCLLPVAKRLKRRFDYSTYGVAPLLGLGGLALIGHGRSKARAVESAIGVAKRAVDGKVVEAIKAEMAKYA